MRQAGRELRVQQSLNLRGGEPFQLYCTDSRNKVQSHGFFIAFVRIEF